MITVSFHQDRQSEEANKSKGAELSSENRQCLNYHQNHDALKQNKSPTKLDLYNTENKHKPFVLCLTLHS